MKKPLQHARHSGHEYRHLRTDGRVPAYVSLHAESARLSGHAMRVGALPVRQLLRGLWPIVVGLEPTSPQHRRQPR